MIVLNSQILFKQIQSVRSLQSNLLELDIPTWRIIQSIRVVQLILVWSWNLPYTELFIRFTLHSFTLKFTLSFAQNQMNCLLHWTLIKYLKCCCGNLTVSTKAVTNIGDSLNSEELWVWLYHVETSILQ